MFRVSDRGAHFVHPADEVLVPDNFLGWRSPPVPREYDDDPPLGAPSVADGQMSKLFQGKRVPLLFTIRYIPYELIHK